MAGEGIEQPEVAVGVVADLPVELPDVSGGEQAAFLNLGPRVGYFTWPAIARPRRQSLADLVVDALDSAEERIAVSRKYVRCAPEGKVPARTEQLPCFPVPNSRVDPVPGCRGVHQAVARSRRRPGLECPLATFHLPPPRHIAP